METSFLKFWFSLESSNFITGNNDFVSFPSNTGLPCSQQRKYLPNITKPEYWHCHLSFQVITMVIHEINQVQVATQNNCRKGFSSRQSPSGAWCVLSVASHTTLRKCVLTGPRDNQINISETLWSKLSIFLIPAERITVLQLYPPWLSHDECKWGNKKDKGHLSVVLKVALVPLPPHPQSPGSLETVVLRAPKRKI